jgi:hypothetical protein
MIWPNKITGANAGGRHQLPMRTRWAARVAQFCRSPQPSTTPRMSRSNRDRALWEDILPVGRTSRYPCDPCNPRFTTGAFLNRGLRGLRGWATHSERNRGPEKANQPVESTATRQMLCVVGADNRLCGLGRRASPFRSA